MTEIACEHTQEGISFLVESTLDFRHTVLMLGAKSCILKL